MWNFAIAGEADLVLEILDWIKEREYNVTVTVDSDAEGAYELFGRITDLGPGAQLLFQPVDVESSDDVGEPISIAYEAITLIEVH